MWHILVTVAFIGHRRERGRDEKLDSVKTTNPDGTGHETGTEVSPAGVTNEYTIDRVKNSDGSSTIPVK